MEVPLRISFKDHRHSAELEARIRAKAAQLEKFFPRITSMSVFVEPTTGRHRQGVHYHVSIDMTLPGAEIVVGRNTGISGAHEDVNVAVRDSFRAARRQLEDYVRIHFKGRKRHRAFVKQPPESGPESIGPPHPRSP